MLEKIDLSSTIALKWTIIIAIFSIIFICICFDVYFIATLSAAIKNVVKELSSSPTPWIP